MTPARVATLCVAAIVALGGGGGSGVACAEMHTVGFDDGRTTWRATFDRTAVGTTTHRRQSESLHSGAGAEQWQSRVVRAGTEARFVHALPPARVIDDLTLTLWLRATQPGARLHLRLVFPDRTNPATGDPLTVELRGDAYTTPGRWQRLTCAATDKRIRDELQRLRFRLDQSDLMPDGLYADQAVITTALAGGAVELLFDDLEYGPIVSPEHPSAIKSVALEVPRPDAPAEFRLNRLSVEGRPFFPIIAPFYKAQGETVAGFAAAGPNVAWIEFWHDEELLGALRAAGLWATVAPPRATDEQGGVLGARQAGLPAFGAATRAILFWNLGARIPPSQLDELAGWLDQIRSADDLFNRPAAADVTGGERPFSRHLAMLSTARHITHTAISFDAYRDWLISRRQAAYPGTFFWTWIQTEPNADAVAHRAATGQAPLVMEPEQMRLQVYAALSAGCRAVGFWKWAPFETAGPGALERRLILAQLSMELELLGPLLATGTVSGRPIPFTVNVSKPGSDGRRIGGNVAVDLTGRRTLTGSFAASERPEGTLDATVIKTDRGILLLPIWFGDGAQFCPGPMAANDVEIVVPGIDETASAWEISTTGIRSLRAPRVAGGKRITLKKLDQTAAIFFTAEPSAIDALLPVIEQLAPHSAAVSVSLAKAKRDRVLPIYQELVSLGHGQPDGPGHIRGTEYLIQRADAALARRDFAGAKEAADDAMQMLRSLQRAHWEAAVRNVSSPMSSPHSVCFSTLPEHYRLISRFGRSIMESADATNLLPGGRFENIEEMLNAGWEHIATDNGPLRGAADLAPNLPREGAYALRLYARMPANTAAPLVVDRSPVTVLSPSMPVRAGQVLHISGWVMVPRPMALHDDGAMLSDNLLGSSGGLHWTQTSGWERFQLLREVPADGDYVLTLTLHNAGEVQFDDLRVVPHDPRTPVAEVPPPAPPAGAFDRFIERIPGLPTRR